MIGIGVVCYIYIVNIDRNRRCCRTRRGNQPSAYWSRTATRFLPLSAVSKASPVLARAKTARFQVVEPVRSTPEILPRGSIGPLNPRPSTHARTFRMEFSCPEFLIWNAFLPWNRSSGWLRICARDYTILYPDLSKSFFFYPCINHICVRSFFLCRVFKFVSRKWWMWNSFSSKQIFLFYNI